MKTAYFTNGVVITMKRQCQLKRAIKRIKYPETQVYFRCSDQYFQELGKHYDKLYQEYTKENEQ